LFQGTWYNGEATRTFASVKAESKAYLGLHFAIFLWGFTAILGKLISFAEIPLVWHRLWITCLSFLLIPRIFRSIREVPVNRRFIFAGIGIVVALHWVAFYGSIKYSNASFALSALATSSLFTSFLEPAITKSRFNLSDVLLGLLVIVGISLIFSVNKVYTKGLVWGIAAAFLAALFSTLNKKYIGDYPGKAISLLELGSGFLFLSVLLVFTTPSGEFIRLIPGSKDLFLLVLLGVGCTTIPYLLSIHALRYISAFTSNLSINMEPIYGIAMAVAFLGESKELNVNFYLGTLLILLAVFTKPLIRFSLQKVKKQAKKN
jgi:drug/metabolite transporter (DMT)-like permease